mmetsp:Transcript_124357/g.247975  ORF Transcript_124357/g.247975 Transcript_124357/m.247975 type:complete len:207 (+) Transcript_124357:264-884(+)
MIPEQQDERHVVRVMTQERHQDGTGVLLREEDHKSLVGKVEDAQTPGGAQGGQRLAQMVRRIPIVGVVPHPSGQCAGAALIPDQGLGHLQDRYAAPLAAEGMSSLPFPLQVLVQPTQSRGRHLASAGGLVERIGGLSGTGLLTVNSVATASGRCRAIGSTEVAELCIRSMGRLSSVMMGGRSPCTLTVASSTGHPLGSITQSLVRA